MGRFVAGAIIGAGLVILGGYALLILDAAERAAEVDVADGGEP